MATPKRKILYVVEDDDNWELVRTLLNGKGFAVQRGWTVAEAVNAAIEGIFHLYLLDNFSFRDGTGRDACLRIRAFDQNTPILFYSGCAYPKEIESAMAAGADDYITLPDLDCRLPDLTSTLVNRAHVRSLEATQEELSVTEAQLCEMFDDLKNRALKAATILSQAQKRLLKAQASIAFIKAGGTPANFERMWPDVLQKATQRPRFRARR